MRAVRIDGQTPGGKRKCLADLVPLDTPFSIQIFPVYACNLACNYCIHSIPQDKRGFVTDKILLDYDLYEKCIDELADFPHKLKMLRFAGTGEPLLHKNIAKMVNYAKRKNIANTIDIVTNGLALSAEMSKNLVAAGVDKIRISVQGLDDVAYSYVKKNGIFLEFVNNIKFLYDNRHDTKIYIKIIDSALKENEEDKFLNIFGDICDFIAIEHLIPAVDKIDYDKIYPGQKHKLTQNGALVHDVKICPQPFYMLQLNPDGKVVPCCSMETAYIIGDISYESISDIWQGKKMKHFIKNQLLGKKDIYPVCQMCRQYKYAIFEEDILDAKAEEILRRY